ncbi:hypothetical protein PGUG_03758 [Meyerozyma guilliermondii ATCC 6260]|uniref:DASH complex subunit DUO1 n=1 Tax=Meyerozyma guilliermondii (strain ATCC 6260 / CBS 566 / DSM 6381 / JCM 1539 / NBRC 10279 / NRRL Y-324) TaxID=294746 RepID=A5DKF7_PICGU|nr:uncharacterized protein PGUG_03758 [Meyerozyma guilliermondii ATCC 6260]EDK39660.1 hypothetical protein PGUG_03758 [Meyerozyma guilliermondii ATCC 6260]
MSDRHAALEKELRQLETVNAAVSDLIGTLRTTRQNIAITHEATDDTQKLLNKWVQILSQTNFTRDILTNPHWQLEEEEGYIESRLQQEKELTETLASLRQDNEELTRKLEARETKRGVKRPRTPNTKR